MLKERKNHILKTVKKGESMEGKRHGRRVRRKRGRKIKNSRTGLKEMETEACKLFLDVCMYRRD